MWSINKKLLPVKAHYFLFNAGIVPLYAWGSIFARHVGLSAFTVGCMLTTLSVLGVTAKIILSGIADKFNKRRIVFLLTILLCLSSTVGLFFVKSRAIEWDADILCHNRTYMKYCSNTINTSIIITGIKESTPTFDITCSMKCVNVNNFGKEICDHWNGACSVEHDDRIEFIATFPNTHFITTETCFYGLVSGVNFTKNNKMTDFRYVRCENDTHAPCKVSCDNAALTQEFQMGQSSLTHDLVQPIFWIVFILYAFYTCGITLNFSLTDTVCFQVLDDRPDLYGRQRLFGALSYGLFTIICGISIDDFSGAVVNDYSSMYVIAGAAFLIDLIIFKTLDIKQSVKTLSVSKHVFQIFKSMKVIVYCIWCIFSGMFSGVCFQFLFWHLDDISTGSEKKFIRTLQGFTTFCNTIMGELPTFFYSNYILKNVGPTYTMTFLLFSSCIRFCLYSLLTNPIWVLPIELLSGFVFSMTYSVIAFYSSKIAPLGTECTVQAVFGAIFEGIGMSLGYFVGGLLFNSYRGSGLFSILSIVALIATILHALVCYKLESRSSTEPENRFSSIIYSNPSVPIAEGSNSSYLGKFDED